VACRRLSLCLQRKAGWGNALGVLNDWITAALTLGASLQNPPRQESFGAEAWLLDPEGDRLLLLVLPWTSLHEDAWPAPTNGAAQRLEGVLEAAERRGHARSAAAGRRTLHHRGGSVREPIGVGVHLAPFAAPCSGV
jgi:hypothetical protein